MARTLDQIITELNASYQPQKDQFSSAIQTVDPQMQAEEQGLQAAKTDAFSQIDQQANRRGLFYGGMPIAEEQRYTGQNFLPSLANMRAKYAQQKFDLVNALNKVTTDEYSQAEGIHQNELDTEEKAREFDRQLAAQQAAARAAAGAGGSASPSFSFGGAGGAPTTAAPARAGAAPASSGAVDKNRAYAAVTQLIATKNTGLINNTISAIQQSAARGNAYDQYKLQLLSSMLGKAGANGTTSNLGKAVNAGAVPGNYSLGNNVSF